MLRGLPLLEPRWPRFQTTGPDMGRMIGSAPYICWDLHFCDRCPPPSPPPVYNDDRMAAIVACLLGWLGMQLGTELRGRGQSRAEIYQIYGAGRYGPAGLSDFPLPAIRRGVHIHILV